MCCRQLTRAAGGRCDAARRPGRRQTTGLLSRLRSAAHTSQSWWSVQTSADERAGRSHAAMIVMLPVERLPNRISADQLVSTCMLHCPLCLQLPPPQTCCTCCHLHPNMQVPSLRSLEAQRDSLLAAHQVWCFVWHAECWLHHRAQ